MKLKSPSSIYHKENDMLYVDFLKSQLSTEQQKAVKERKLVVTTYKLLVDELQTYIAQHFLKYCESNSKTNTMTANDEFFIRYVDEQIWKQNHRYYDKRLLSYLYQCFIPLVYNDCIKYNRIDFTQFLISLDVPVEFFLNDTEYAINRLIQIIVSKLSIKTEMFHNEGFKSSFDLLYVILFQHFDYFKDEELLSYLKDCMQEREATYPHKDISEFIPVYSKYESRTIFNKPFKKILQFSQFFVPDKFKHLGNIIDVEMKARNNTLGNEQLKLDFIKHMLFASDNDVVVNSMLQPSKYLLSLLSDKALLDFNQNVFDSSKLSSFVDSEFLENYNHLVEFMNLRMNAKAQKRNESKIVRIKKIARKMSGKLHHCKTKFDIALKMERTAKSYKYMRMALEYIMKDVSVTLGMNENSRDVLIDKNELMNVQRYIKQNVYARLNEFFSVMNIIQEMMKYSPSYRESLTRATIDIFAAVGKTPIFRNNDCIDFQKTIPINKETFERMSDIIIDAIKNEKLNFQNSGDLTTENFIRDYERYFIHTSEFCDCILSTKSPYKEADEIRVRLNMFRALEKEDIIKKQNYMMFLVVYLTYHQIIPTDGKRRGLKYLHHRKFYTLKHYYLNYGKEDYEMYQRGMYRELKHKSNIKFEDKHLYIVGDRCYRLVLKDFVKSQDVVLKHSISNVTIYDEEDYMRKARFLPLRIQDGEFIIKDAKTNQELRFMNHHYCLSFSELLTFDKEQAIKQNIAVGRKIVSTLGKHRDEVDVIKTPDIFGCDGHSYLVTKQLVSFHDTFHKLLSGERLKCNDEQTSKEYL